MFAFFYRIITPSKEEAAPQFTFGKAIIVDLISLVTSTIAIVTRRKLTGGAFADTFLDNCLTTGVGGWHDRCTQIMWSTGKFHKLSTLFKSSY